MKANFTLHFDSKRVFEILSAEHIDVNSISTNRDYVYGGRNDRDEGSK